MSEVVSKLAASSSVLVQLLLKRFKRSPVPKIFGLFVLFLLLKYRSNAIGTRRTRLPGPRGLPLIGNLLLLASIPPNKFSHFHDLQHARYGSTWTFTVLGLGRGIMVNDPACIEHVLKTNFWAYEKGPVLREAMADLLGNGIFGADGQNWKWQRKMASHIFNVKAFRDYTSNVFVHESQRVSDYFDRAVEQGSVVDIHDIFLKFTLDSFGEISFGQSFGCLDKLEGEIEFAAAFDRLNATVSNRLFLGSWRLIEWLSGTNKQVAKDKKIIVDFSLDIIRNRRLKGYTKPQKDLLQLFMELKGEDGEVLSDDMLKDSMLNFVIAGRDTTAQALSWMFYLLHRSSTDKNIVKRLQEEIDTVLGDDEPTYESHKKMKFAEACSSLLPKCSSQYQDVRSGRCFANRDTTIWGPDALEYNPDRWLKGDKFTPTQFPAFHAGPRTCLGQQFATIEAITVISILFRRFSFELVDPDHEPPYGAGLTLPIESGLPLRIKRRELTKLTAVTV
ncbi:hypothetical protein BGW38_009562 [Lunasporangiospora selenospora]|uniref:Cytochrome P450 n=1 Tax=Lunasporangiospora selenospora TaxID=979761 RepID=A0A9P6G3D9_9FUNG|nr:hypothetical protein BGW38_009562 [Lunasporangiospora selenospora]